MKSLKFKNLLALVIVLMLAATILVACNGKDVTLSFQTNGGGSIGAIVAKSDQSVTLPDIKETKTENGEVYVFDGWCLDRDLSGVVLRGTITAPKSDTTFYAKWVKGVKLTLNPGSGKLNNDQLYFYLRAGAPIFDLVKDIVPTVEGDLTFSEWYLDGESIDAETVMPDEDATLTAKYTVGFTIKHFLQNSDGEYIEDETLRKTSTGLVGAIASGGVPLTLKDHVFNDTRSDYIYNPTRSERTANIRLTEVAANNNVEYYYDMDGYHVTYIANGPDGTVVSGEMREQIAAYGDEPLKALPCEFELAGYRFLGWAARKTGYSPTMNTVNYYPGDTLKFGTASSLELYAIWQPGAADALGGSDYLFTDPEYALKGDGPLRNVYLIRDKVEEKTGELDPETGVFTFKEGDKVVLKGILDTETNFFYYYNETLYNEYHSKDDSNIGINIRADYAATYHDSTKQVEGKVTFDTEWGYYVFTSANYEDKEVDNSEKLMLRFQFEEDEQGATVLAFQNMEEAGYYATQDGYPLIYLDGLGSFTYYYDPENPTYRDYYTNEAVLVTNGTYQVTDNDYYACSMYAGDPTNPNLHMEDFLFRILKDKKPDTTKINASTNTNLPNGFDSDDIKETAIERSEFYGQLETNLYLDGFGGGTYTTYADENDKTGTKHTGKYSIIHNFWLTENSADADQVWFINFEYEGATEDVYYAIRQNRSGTVIAQYFGSVPHGEDGGLWLFDGSITIGGTTYDNAFIMFLLNKNNETMLLVKIDEQELNSGDMASIFAPMHTGTVTKSGDIFTFVSVSNDALRFKRSDNTEGGINHAEFIANESGDTGEDREIDKNLTVHPSTGKATYIDENGTTHNDVTYTYSGGEYLEFYAFHVDQLHNLYYYRDNKNGEQEFKKISGDRILDYAYVTQDVMFAYPARLLLADGGKAFIALPMAIGEPVYVGLGTYTEADGLYGVEFTDWREDELLLDFFGGEGYEPSLRTFHSYYNSFNFRTEGGNENETGKFYARFDKTFNDELGDMYFTLDNFKSSGYDNVAIYTLESGYELEGTFYRMDIVVVFEVRDSDDRVISSFYLKEDTANNRMKNVSEDAGLYYFYDIDSVSFETFGPDYGGSLTDYFIYDGENSVTVVDIQEDYLENRHPGTMERTENWTEDFREYKIQETDTGKVYRVLLGKFNNIWGDEYLVYDLQSNAYSGEYLTEDYGVLKGNGYRLNSATYDVDGDGTVDYTGLMVRATFDKRDLQTHAYTVDDKGDVIVFTYRVNEEISESIVFDAITDANNNIMYLKERKLRFGSFAAWDVGRRTGSYMYLDGQGNAELYDANGTPSGTGTYQPAPEISETSYKYESSAQTFYFAIYIESEDGGSTYFEYRRYTQNVEGEYEAEDWSHLTMNGFGEITFTDRYGVVYQGYYNMLDSANVMLITYDGSGITFTFTFDFESKTFMLVDQGKIEVDPDTPEEPADPAGE